MDKTDKLVYEIIKNSTTKEQDKDERIWKAIQERQFPTRRWVKRGEEPDEG